MARDYTGRQTTDTRTMDLATKVCLLLLGILFLLAAIITPLVVLMSKTSHGTVSYGDFIYQYNIKDGNIYYDIKRYIGQNTEHVIIPSEYNGSPVVGIMKNAFNGNQSNVHKNIKKISFDDTSYGGLSRIDSEAFVGLENLREFTLPAHITSINEKAFKNCNILGDFVVGDLGAYYENSHGIVGERVTISPNAFDGVKVSGKLIVEDSTVKNPSIVPSEVLNAFGNLDASEVVLNEGVDVFNLGTNSFASFYAMEELTVYTSDPKNPNNTYAQSNFNMKNCNLLKKLNVLYGSSENAPKELTQKFVQAPIENLYFGEGVKSLGSGTLVGYTKLKNVTVNNNATLDQAGNFVSAEGFKVDLNIAGNEDLSNLKFKIKFENEDKGNIQNVLTIDREGGNAQWTAALSSNFLRLFTRDEIRVLNIGANIQVLNNATLEGLFTNSTFGGESGKFYGLNFDKKSKIASLPDSLFGQDSDENLKLKLGRIDVTGPDTDNSVIYTGFNTTNGRYKERHSYNGNLLLGNAEYTVNFKYNMPRENTEGFRASLWLNGIEIPGPDQAVQEENLKASIRNGGRLNLPVDLWKETNQYILVGWAQYGCLNEDGSLRGKEGTGSGVKYMFSPVFGSDERQILTDNGTPYFMFTAKDFEASIINEDGKRSLDLFALWEKKTYHTVTYLPQFNSTTLTYANTANVTAYNEMLASLGKSEITVSHVAGKENYYKFNLSYFQSHVESGSTLENALVYSIDGKPTVAGADGAKVEKILSMPEIYQSGYIFKGWKDDKGKEYDSSSTCTSKLTLYAQWEEVKYNLTYHAKNEGFNVIKDDMSTLSNLTYNSSFALRIAEELKGDNAENGFKVPGYHFVSWQITVGDDVKTFTAQDIENNWKEGKLFSDFLFELFGTTYLYSPEEGISYVDTACAMFTPQQLYLYANYEANSYSVSYDFNGGNCPNELEDNYADKNILFTDANFNLASGKGIRKLGYNFTGWGIRKTDLTVTGKVFNIVTDGNEDISSVNANDLLKAKHELDASGSLSYDNAAGGQNLELVAIWQAVSVSVTFTSNGGNGESVIKTFAFDEAQTLGERINFAKQGNKLVGFKFSGNDTVLALDAELTGEDLLKAYYGRDLTYNDVAVTTLTLNAEWVAHTYTLVLDLGGGEKAEITIKYGETYSNLSNIDYPPTPSLFDHIVSDLAPTGKTFNGVFTGENGTGSQIWDADGEPTNKTLSVAFDKEGEHNVYLSFTDTQYTLNFGANTQVGGDAVSIDAKGCTLSITRGGQALSAGASVALGQTLTFAFNASENFVFSDVFAVKGGTTLLLSDYNDANKTSIKDLLSSEGNVTITQEFIENYLSSGNAFNFVALFVAKEFVVEFSVPEPWEVSNWNLSGINGYEYIYKDNIIDDANIIGVKSTVVVGKPYGYVKTASGYETVGFPSPTLTGGIFGGWVVIQSGANQTISASNTVNTDYLGEDDVMHLSAQCSAFQMFNINITADETAFAGFELTQNFKEGGSDTLSGTGTSIEGLRKDATITLTLKVKSGYTITSVKKNGIEVSISGDSTSKTLENFVIVSDTTVEILSRAINYKVRFDKNNAEARGTMADMSFAYAETKNLTPNAFTLEGFNFTGWATEPAGSVVYADNASVSNLSTEDEAIVTLYAIWQEKSNYAVIYNANGGDGTAISQTGLKFTDTLTFANNTYTRLGYTPVAGWFLQNAEGTAISSSTMALSDLIAAAKAAGQDVDRNNTITLYAHWDAKDVTVTINATLADGTVTFQNADGWAVSGNSATKTFKFDELLGTLPTPNGTVTGQNVTFEGWFTDSEFKNPVNSNTVVNKEDALTLYAKFTVAENTYNLKINPNGGTYNEKRDETQVGYTYGHTLDALATQAVREGYTFAGWFANADGTGTEYDATSTMPAAELTVYAKWNAVTYTVEFNKTYSDATGTMDSATFTYDASNTLPANNFARTGYEFVGWALTLENAQNGTVKFANGATVTENLANTQGATVTLYAVFSSLTYTVTFDTNYKDGFTGGALNKTTAQIKYGEAIGEGTLAAFSTMPSKLGYNLTFAGWFGKLKWADDPEAYADKKITASTIFSETEIIDLTINHNNHTATFFAGWLEEAKPYALTLEPTLGGTTGVTSATFGDLAGWSISNSSNPPQAQKAMIFNTKIGDLPTLTGVRTGYTVTVAGWWLDINGNGTQDEGETFTGNALSNTTYSWATALTARAIFKVEAHGVNVTVFHYLENTNDTGFTKFKEETLTDKMADSTLTLSTLALAGDDYNGNAGKFAYSKARLTYDGADVASTTVNADGSTEVHLFYSRLSHTLTVTVDAGVQTLKINGMVATLSGNSTSRTMKYEEEATLEVTLVKGYILGGWSNGTNALTTNFKMDNADATLTFTSAQNTYALTLNANGGSISANSAWTGSGEIVTKNVKYGEPLGTLPDATTTAKNGFTFGGWFNSLDGSGVEFTSESTMPSQPLTLIAKWTAVAYNITLNLANANHFENGNGWITASSENGKNVSLSGSDGTIISIEFGAAVKVIIKMKQGCFATGATFNKTDVNGDDIEVTRSQSANILTLTFTYNCADDSTLTLSSDVVKYTLVFEPNGGRLNGSTSNLTLSGLSYLNTDTIDSKITSKSRDNYQFAGWEVSDNGTDYREYSKYDNADLPKPQLSDNYSEDNGNKTVYLRATWTANQFTIKAELPNIDGLKASDATLNVVKTSVSYGASHLMKDVVSLTLNGIQNATYKMKGWKVKVGSGDFISGAYLADEFTAGETQSQTLALNFNAGNAWFDALGTLNNGDTITFVPDIEIQQVSVNLEFIFGGMSKDADKYLISSAGSLLVNNHAVANGTRIDAMLNAYVNANADGFEITKGDGSKETINFAGFTLDTSATNTSNPLSNTISLASAGKTYKFYYSRNSYTISITTMSDRYTQTKPQFASSLDELLNGLTYNQNSAENLISISIFYNQTADLSNFVKGITRTGFTLGSGTDASGMASNALRVFGSVTSNYVIGSTIISANNLSDNGTIPVAVMWNIIPVKITFDALDGTFKDANANPNTSDLANAGFVALSSTDPFYGTNGFTHYNAEKDLYYSTTSNTVYRIIPQNTEVSGISGFMPTPYKDATNKFVGWYDSHIPNDSYIKTSGSNNVFAGTGGSVNVGTGNITSGTKPGGYISYTSDEGYAGIQEDLIEYIEAQAYEIIVPYGCTASIDLFVGLSTIIWGQNGNAPMGSDKFRFNGNSYLASATVDIFKLNEDGTDEIYLSDVLSIELNQAELNNGNDEITDGKSISISKSGKYRVEANAYARATTLTSLTLGGNTFASVTVPGGATAEKYSPEKHGVIIDIASQSPTYGHIAYEGDTTLYAGYAESLVLEANNCPNGELTNAEFAEKLQMNSASGWIVNGTQYYKPLDTIGYTVGTLPTPVREGYKFKEWNSFADGTGSKLTASSTKAGLNSDKKYYAIWEKAITIKFVSLNVDGSERDLGNTYYQYLQYGDKFTAFPVQSQSTCGVRLGYKANGKWQLSDGTAVANNLQTFTEATFSSYVENFVLKIYVVWEECEIVNVTFKVPNNAGEFVDYMLDGSAVSFSVNVGDNFFTYLQYENMANKIAFPNISNLESLTSGHYHIDSANQWLTNSTSLANVSALISAKKAGSTSNFAQGTTVNANTTVYANAMPVYSLTFIANADGTGDNTVVGTKVENVYAGMVINLPTNLTNAGYRFVGYTASRLGLISGATTPTSKISTTVSGATASKPLGVIYQSNYNRTASDSTTWALTQDMLSSMYTEQGTTDLKVYAVWAKTYTLEFNPNGGMIVSGSKTVEGVCHGDTNFTEPVVVRNGYELNKWAYSDGTTVGTSIDVSHANASYIINIRAYWDRLYTVTYMRYDDATNKYVVWDTQETTGSFLALNGSSLARSANYLSLDTGRIANCIGWSTSSIANTVNIQFNTYYSTDRDYILYAVYQPQPKLVFTGWITNSSYGILDTIYIEPNTAVESQIPTVPSRTGYSFTGWSTNQNGPVNFYRHTKVTEATYPDAYTKEGLKIYAIYETQTHGVTIIAGNNYYDLIYGSDSQNISGSHSFTVNYGESFTIKQDRGAIMGYQYDISATGNCKLSNTVIYSTDTRDSVDVTNISGDVTITITSQATYYEYSIGLTKAYSQGTILTGAINNGYGTCTEDMYMTRTYSNIYAKYIGTSDVEIYYSGCSNESDVANVKVLRVSGRECSVTYYEDKANINGLTITESTPNFLVKLSSGWVNYSTLRSAYSGTNTIYAWESGSNINVGSSTVNIQTMKSGLSFTGITLANSGSVVITGNDASTVGVKIDVPTVSALGGEYCRIAIDGTTSVSINATGTPIESYLVVNTTANVTFSSGWHLVSGSSTTYWYQG